MSSKGEVRWWTRAWLDFVCGRPITAREAERMREADRDAAWLLRLALTASARGGEFVTDLDSNEEV